MGLLDNAKDALNSDKGEQVSDTGIEKAEDAITDKTGGKFDDKIDKAGDAADSKIGND
ncbi:antitoxin protein of toxin-antitoxin system [Frondihabitans sp. PhB188]|uniref:antitoxin n=1 Tax=Frondihabitans sp. PhB188 TaxID=2485200 RepID=UPI000F468152|nr:antitoxin [Frondihabitans sp. PhB188]ROQ30981.1 antitoxin protein of toxin-antitoxin system [Frondihabitans sp. PhB188]